MSFLYSPPLTRSNVRKAQRNDKSMKDFEKFSKGLTAEFHKHVRAICSSQSREEMDDGRTDSAAGDVTSRKEVSRVSRQSVSQNQNQAESEAEEQILPKKRLIQTTAEELALDGAPEGELLDVTVLKREELVPCEHPKAELEQLKKLCRDKHIELKLDQLSSVSKKLEWGDHHFSVETFRRIAAHHSSLLDAESIEVMLPLVLSGINSLRSAMTRNSILCMEDLFFFKKRDMIPFLEISIPILISHTGNQRKFIRDIVQKAIGEATKQCAGEELLYSLLLCSSHKNQTVIGMSGLQTAKCLAAMKIGERKKEGSNGLERCWFFQQREVSWAFLLENMERFLASTNATGRKAAQKSLGRVRKEIGEDLYSTVVRDTFDSIIVRDQMLHSSNAWTPLTSVNREKNGKPMQRSMSLKERMMQQRQKQQQQSKPSQQQNTVLA